MPVFHLVVSSSISMTVMRTPTIQTYAHNLAVKQDGFLLMPMFVLT